MNQDDLKKLRSIYGEWEIYKVERFSTSFIKKETVEKRIGEKVIISADQFKYFNKDHKKIDYEFRTVYPNEPGVMKTSLDNTTCDKGILPGRDPVLKLFVKKEGKIRTELEIANENEIILPSLGWAYFLRRVKKSK